MTFDTCQPDSTRCTRLGNHLDQFSLPLKFSNFSHKFSFPCLNNSLSLYLSSPKPYVIKNCSSSSTWRKILADREQQQRDPQFNNETPNFFNQSSPSIQRSSPYLLQLWYAHFFFIFCCVFSATKQRRSLQHFRIAVVSLRVKRLSITATTHCQCYNVHHAYQILYQSDFIFIQSIICVFGIFKIKIIKKKTKII